MNAEVDQLPDALIAQFMPMTIVILVQYSTSWAMGNYMFIMNSQVD